MIPVQFITTGANAAAHLLSARQALEGGCKWVQLRMKQSEESEVEQTARTLLPLCRDHEAILIVDDSPLAAGRTGADGVHLGAGDMPPSEARELLGEEFIIGGTANTIEDVERLARQGVDYLGCGPFRFTSTKQNLAPLLGLEGYARLLQAMAERNISIPVVAIGGITLPDIQPLMHLGVSGIAVCGAVAHAPDPVQAMHDFIHALD